MRMRIILIGLCLVFSPVTSAEKGAIEVKKLENGMSSPVAGIEDIAWLAGHWKGEGLGGEAEDVIAPAADGQMMGMFRHFMADGSVNFYEFYVFAEKDGSLTQRMKHFSPMLSGWEEKDEYVEFPLVSIGEKAAYFDGLSYRLEKDGILTVAVRVSEDQDAVFRYRRVE